MRGQGLADREKLEQWAKPDMSEHQLQRAVAKYLDAVIRKPWIWTALDAGAGKMKPKTAQQRKNRGVKKGWPDVLIMGPGPVVLGIELKAEKGAVSEGQREMEAAFFACKAWYVLCRSVDEVERALAFCKANVARAA